ncbi:MAG: hypothetical protein R6V03_11170 [Kiritimatiellia bacterium]
MTDESDNVFTIKGLSATHPANGAVYTIDTAVPDGLQWFSARTEDTTAELYYSPDGINFDDVITFSGIPYIGNIDADPSWNHHDWDISGKLMPSTNAWVKVIAGSYESLAGPFTLRGIRITQPSQGESMDIGTTETLRWASAGLFPNAYVSNRVSTTGRGGPYVPGGLPGHAFVLNNSAFWPVDPDLDPTTNAVIRMEVTSPTNDTDVVVYSDPFTLKGLKFTEPAAGATWTLGASETVGFLSAGMGSGARANVYYSPDGVNFDMSRPVTNNMRIYDGLNNFTWNIESSKTLTRTPSTNAHLMVKSGSYSNISEAFTLRGIRVTKPVGADIWAVSDLTNTIEWTQVGAAPPYSIDFTLWEGGSPVYSENITPSTPGPSYDWAMTSNAIGSNVTITVTDSGAFSGISEVFEVVAQPSINIVNPSPGDFWKVTETNTIEWRRGGKMSNDFWVAYSPYPFSVTNVLRVGACDFDEGVFSYTWANIPNALGPCRLIITNRADAQVWDVFSDFEIAPKFEISPFVGDLYALKPKPVDWVTRGSVTEGVDLYYSTDPLRETGSWTLINTEGPYTAVAHDQPSTYLWTVANVRTNTVWIRIQDHGFSNRVFEADKPGPYDDYGMFEVKYYRIVWRIFDSATSNELDHLSVADSVGWSDSGLDSPITHWYPYGTEWDTVWYREFFNDEVVFHWTSEPSRTNYVWMDRSEIEPDYHVLANFSYNMTASNFLVQSWLERGGSIQEKPRECRIKVYDASGNLIETISSTIPTDSGVFWMTWDVSGESYSGSEIFFATVEIEYSGETYSSGVTFSPRMTASAEIETVIGFIEASTAAIRDDVENVRSNVVAVGTNVSAVRSSLDAFRTETGTGISNLTDIAVETRDNVELVATNIGVITGTVERAVTTITGELAKVVGPLNTITQTLPEISSDVVSDLARILTRPDTVQYGSTNLFLYKTRPGYAAASVPITVSNSAQGLVYSGNMTEIIGGIYEEELIADWGTNSYTITCSDPHARDSAVVRVTAAGELSEVPQMIADLSTELNSLESGITDVSDLVKDIPTTDITPVVEDIDELKTMVQGIETGESTMEEVKEAVNAIDSRIGSESDSAGSDSVFGKVSKVSAEVDSVGVYAADAKKNAQSAKTEASDASSGVDEVKDLLEKGDLDGVMGELSNIKQSMLAAKEMLEGMPELLEFARMREDVENMTARVQELAASEGWESLLEGPTVGGEGGAVEGEESDVETLVTTVRELKGAMGFMLKLMDKEVNKPVVEDALVGAE